MRSARAGAALWAFAAVMFLVYPVVRPYSTEVGLEGAAAFGRTAWVVAHVSAVLGFIAAGLALRSLEQVVGATAGAPAASAAVVVTWVGVGLTLTYYGAETFALNAVGARAAADGDAALMRLADPIRNGGVQLTLFGVGLLLVLAGGILAAVAVRRSGVLPPWAGWPLALGLVLFLPQFFAVPGLRVAHGALMLIGCLVLAWAFWRPRVSGVLANQ